MVAGVGWSLARVAVKRTPIRRRRGPKAGTVMIIPICDRQHWPDARTSMLGMRLGNSFGVDGPHAKAKIHLASRWRG